MQPDIRPRSRFGGHLVCGLALMALAGVAFAGEKGKKVELLGQPCRAKQVLGGRIFRDRATGRELFAITNMNEVQGAELIVIDFARDTGKVYKAPAGAGCWAINEVPGDRLVLGTFYDGHFMVFDLKTMRFIQHVRFGKEEYIWNCALGKDGRLYGGTYPGGRLGALDLTTYAVEDCGAPAPPNLYLRNVSATPDGRILCSFGMDKPTALLYDPATKQFAPLPETLAGASIGATWEGYFLAGGRVFQGENFTEVKPPPFPTPPADKGGWSADTTLTTPNTLYLRQGNALYRYRKGDSGLTFLADIDLRGGWIMAAGSNGELLGVRGQDYFVIRPGDKAPTLKPIPTEAGPRGMLFLKADPKGRLWGGSIFGQTIFWMDPKTKKYHNTGAVCDSGGEVYDVTFLNGKVYTASYAGGDITEYDPTRPWDQWNRKNPRPLTTVGPDYIRPTGGIVVGPGGKLISGWMAKYGTYGGLIAITDPKTGATEKIENPLGEQAVEGLAADDRFAYVGTSLSANGLPAKPNESARFGVIDLTTRQTVFTHTFEGASSVRALAYDAKTKQVAFAVGGTVRHFDTVRREFLPPVPDAPSLGSHAMAAPGQGRVYYGSGKAVIALDLERGQAERLAELPANVSNVTIGPDGTVYAACGPDVYRINPS